MLANKQTTYTDVIVGEQIFHIRPFAAFTSVNILGQLNQFFTPLMGGVSPLLDLLKNGKALDQDMGEALPVVMSALGSVSGDRLEKMLKTLLIQYENISVDEENTSGQTKAVLLNEVRAQEIFCQNAENMFLLGYEVIKVNYDGFFPKLASQFGLAITPKKKTDLTKNMENSMANSLAT